MQQFYFRINTKDNEMETIQLNHNTMYLQPNPASFEEKSCIAYLVFRDNTDYERFLMNFDRFISNIHSRIRIEKLLCASLMTCELRIEGDGDCQSFRENIVDAYNRVFYSGQKGLEIEEAFDEFWNHPDFIIHTVEVDRKKNYNYVQQLY